MLIKNEKGEYFLKNFFSLLFFEAKLFLWGLFRDGAYLHGQCDAMKRIGRALRKRRLLSERIQGG
jgi:hypothetical protein